MQYHTIPSKAFERYGRVLEGYDFQSFLSVLTNSTPMPDQGFLYEPSVPELEAHPVFDQLKTGVFGGMPLQLGFCNGHNRTLNCLEFHKGSEVCIMAYDTVLLLGDLQDLRDGKYHTSSVEAFYVPAGTGIELYATTLHYAPCSAQPGQGFRVANGLPLGTNIGMPDRLPQDGQSNMMMATNKWLLAHPTSTEARNSAYIGLIGDNICLDADK